MIFFIHRPIYYKKQLDMRKCIENFANGVEFIAVILMGPSAVLTDVSNILRRIANKRNNAEGDEIR